MPEVDSPTALKPVILASASRTRADMLRAAGLQLEILPSEVDEQAIISALGADRNPLPPGDVATVLARAKAESVSQTRAGELVIGADQTLELDGRLFQKPRDMDEARRNLLELRGRTHSLHATVVLAVDGETVWSADGSAHMSMREFSPQFLGRYMAAAGEEVLGSVGCYRLEGVGAQLFDRIEGDWFVILGLPLLPLLDELRRCEVLAR